MPDQWIVRVQGREYGPVDLEELRDWKREGRLIRENEVREPGSTRWIPAGELPELFADEPLPPPLPPPPVRRKTTVLSILAETGRIYRRGFGRFLILSALLAVPSICAQLSSAGLGAPAGSEFDLRTALAALFNFSMVLAMLFAWPLYVAGIQILSSALAQGRTIGLQEVLAQALKFWPRVALLCLLVYLAFFLLTFLAFAILLMVAFGASSPALILIALGLLAFQVWMFGRLFVSVLFWQQTVVLEDANPMESLRRSNELARRGRDLPWWRRPFWHGAILASLWSLLALAVLIGPEWNVLSEYVRIVSTTQDPQAMVQAMSAAAAKPAGLAPLSLLLGLLEKILRPLLGIAFVVLYLEVIREPRDRPEE